MDFTLIGSLINFLAQTCGLGLVLIAVLIVIVALARLLASRSWWRGWGSDD